MNQLAIVTAGKVAIVALALGTVLGLAILVAGRDSSSAAPTATHALRANQKIAPDDIQTRRTAALVGRFLRAGVEAGKPVMQAMVSDRQIPPAHPNGFAVIVTIPAEVRSARGIEPGSRVVVSSVGAEVATGTVADIDCDAQDCSVVVGLAARPGFDAAALVGADLSVPPPPPPPPNP